MGKILSARLGACAMALLLAACGADTEQRAIADAKTALQKRDLATARIQLKNALEKNPSSAEARFLFGKLLLQAGDIATAEIELRKALELKHPIDYVAPLLARILLDKQQPAKVIEEFAALKLTDAERQADLSAVVAAAYAGLGQKEKAVALVDSTVASRPTNIPIRLIQARLVASSADVDGALKLLDGVLARESKNSDALKLRGDLLLFGKRDIAGARDTYSKVLETEKSDLYTQSQLISVYLLDRDVKAATQQYETLARQRPSQPQVMILGARLALLNGNPGRAKELTGQLMKLTKDHPTVLFLAAAAEFDLKSLSQAEGHLTKLLAAHPDAIQAREMLAAVYLRSGQPDRALASLRPLIDSSAPSAGALTLAAEANLATGDAKSAEAFFARVTKIKPDDVKARTALALAQAAKGDREGAITELQSIASGDPGTLADMALIDVRMRQRDFDGALKAIDGLERKLPEKALPQHLRGRALLFKFDIANARASFERAVARDPAYFPSVSMLAAMDVAERKLDQAAQRFEALIKADAKNVRALVALAKVKADQGAAPGEVAQLLARAIEARPAEPATHILLIEHWLRNSNPRAAVTAAQAGLAANPDASELLDALGRAQLANSDTVQSLAAFGKLALQQPKSALAQLRIAEVHLRARNADAAESALRKALEISPELLGAQRELIALAVRAKQPEKALRVARTIQKQRPQDAVGYLLEGDVQLAVKNTDAAVPAFRAGLPKRGGGLAAVRLHQVNVAANRKAEAERFADEWLKQNPKDTLLRLYLARQALAADKLPVAEGLYREVIQLDPRNLVAMNNLAWVLAKAGKPGAAEMVERALAQSPEDANTLDTQAFVLGEQGQLPRAIDAAKSAVRLAPGHAPFRLTLAKLYLKSGDKVNAKAELGKLAELGAKFPQHAEVAELLRSI